MGGLNLAQIHPAAFCHPADRRATAALKKVPLLPELMRSLSRWNLEAQVCSHFTHSSIKLSGTQLPTLWRMVNEVAEALCLPPPEAYVSGDPFPNALAFGVERHTVVLTGSLIDLMTDEELKAVITHELAHVLCQHMLYRQVGLALAREASQEIAKFLPAGLVEKPLTRLLAAWYRSAEYSADRAALLILDDPEPLASCLARLAGVPRRFAGEFDLRLFAEQADSYEDSSTFWSRLVTFDLGATSTHPEPAKRAAEILRWAQSEEYRRIRNGEYLTWLEAEAAEKIRIEGVRSCPLCGSAVGELAVCPNCELPQDPALQRLCPRGHPNSVDWKFCKADGLSLSGTPTRSGSPGR